jgi:DNA-binding MarR family transcriptional regulator
MVSLCRVLVVLCLNLIRIEVISHQMSKSNKLYIQRDIFNSMEFGKLNANGKKFLFALLLDRELEPKKKAKDKKGIKRSPGYVNLDTLLVKRQELHEKWGIPQGSLSNAKNAVINAGFISKVKTGRGRGKSDIFRWEWPYFPEHGGVKIQHEMYSSKAFLSLSGGALNFLIILLDNRNIDKLHKKQTGLIRFTNEDSLTAPYRTLEKKHGMKPYAVTRAIDELLAKGFIEIVNNNNDNINYFLENGQIKREESIYSLSENYKKWKKDKVFHVRQKGMGHGWQSNGSARKQRLSM